MKYVRISLVLLVAGVAMVQARAQVPQAPPPPKYLAVVRYDIVAARDTHVALYDRMIRHLQSLDFEFSPPLDQQPKTNREDFKLNQLSGLVDPKNAVKILENSNVATMLLIPDNFALPANPEQEVHVRLELASGLPRDRQRELGEQVRALLAQFDFKEAYGYDHRGYFRKPFTRIVGTVPVGKLDLLVRDLRSQPANWFSAVIPLDEMPAPLRSMNPIRVVEVLPDPAPLQVAQAPAKRVAPFLEKIAPELWQLLVKPAPVSRVKVQIFLVGSAADAERNEMRFKLSTYAPSLVFDGQLGQVVTADVELQHIPNLARLSEVSVIRLARSLTVHADRPEPIAGDNAAALEKSGLAKLHAQGHKGKGVRIAILDYDFRGWQKMVDAKKLPANTKLVDLTPESDPDLKDLPYRGEPETVGHGTQGALAAHLAAPEAQITLVRIDPIAPYQMIELLRYLRGGGLSLAMTRRQDELLVEIQALQNAREQLLQERRRVLEDFTDERNLELKYGFLGPVMGWIFSDRQLHQQKMAWQAKREEELSKRRLRYKQLAAKIESLQGIGIVATPLGWQDRFAVGSASAISRWLNHNPRQLPLWFQAAGNTQGQAWTGYYRDDDNDGILEFAPPGASLKLGRWSREINFLTWKTYGGVRTPVVPANTRVRVSIQWREPHDPDYFLGEDDVYLKPLAPVELVLLRQRDPDLKTLPADAFDVVARSGTMPRRLQHEPTFSIYEQEIEYSTDRPGVFAVQVAKRGGTTWVIGEDPITKQPAFRLVTEPIATGIRPAGVATLPAFEKTWEMHARLFADVVDPVMRPQGRILLNDFNTEQGTVGLPADSRSVISVAAGDLKGKTDATSASGPPPFLDLAPVPDLVSFSSLNVVPDAEVQAIGTSLATPFAAGWAATHLSAGTTREQLLKAIRKGQGSVLGSVQP